MSDISREVKVGGETRTIRKFKSFKATLAGAIVGEVAEDWNALLAAVNKWRAEYREQNKLQISRQQCAERGASLRAEAEAIRSRSDDQLPEGWTRRDAEDRVALLEARATSWEQTVADLGDRPYLELPSNPSEAEIAMYGLPIALKTMLKQVVKLIGLALMPDNELKAAWRQDEVHGKLEEYGYGLLEEMDLGEEVELAVAVWEVIQDQLRPRRQALAKLRGLYGRQETATETTASESPTTSTDESPSESPTSSTPSPPPMAGDPSEPSSDSTTAPTSLSPAA